MEPATLVFLVGDEGVCLGMKKRGFGTGLWNGYGGKVEANEDVCTAAIRELQEESGVVANEKNLREVAELNFFLADGTHIFVTVFLLFTWNGEPVETEEMKPDWFNVDHIPYETMWEDDQYWLPRVLAGEYVKGRVRFDTANKIVEMEWQ